MNFCITFCIILSRDFFDENEFDIGEHRNFTPGIRYNKFFLQRSTCPHYIWVQGRRRFFFLRYAGVNYDTNVCGYKITCEVTMKVRAQPSALPIIHLL